MPNLGGWLVGWLVITWKVCFYAGVGFNKDESTLIEDRQTLQPAEEVRAKGAHPHTTAAPLAFATIGLLDAWRDEIICNFSTDKLSGRLSFSMTASGLENSAASSLRHCPRSTNKKWLNRGAGCNLQETDNLGHKM
jgi:hypothetical protein